MIAISGKGDDRVLISNREQANNTFLLVPYNLTPSSFTYLVELDNIREMLDD